MTPTVVFPPAMPSTDQVTAVLEVPVTLAVNCWVCDVFKVTEAGPIETLTVAGAVPLPVNTRVVGVSEALSLTRKLPLRGPEDAGVKVTCTWQVPPAGTLVPQSEVKA